MIIYEDESLVIPVGLGNNSTDVSKTLQEKNVTITENTTTQVTPDSNYIGLSRVVITTDIPTGVNNQEKSETVHANTSMTIYPDSGYTGLSRVNVTAKADLQDKFAKISQGGVTNITYDEGFDGLNSVEVFVDVPLGKIEFDSSTNAQRVVTDSSGYCDITVNPYTVKDIYVDSSTSPQVIRPTDTDAFNNIYINKLSLDPLNINPSKSMQVFQGAYDFVQVHPVTSSIDSNIVPRNIRKDVSILGVKGTLESVGDIEELTVDSSTSTQVYTPSQGYIGFSKVTVEPYVLDSKTIDSSTVRQIVTSDEDGLSSVTVEPYVLDSKTVKSSTDRQIVTSNEDGLSSVTVEPYALDSKTIDSSTVRQIVTSDKDGLSSVTVDPYTLESRTVDAGTEDKIVTPTRADALSSVKVNKVTSNIDSNIIPENIRKDTTILGVTGTFEGSGNCIPGVPYIESVDDNDGVMIYLGIGTVQEYTTQVRLSCEFYVPYTGTFSQFETSKPARTTKGIVGLAGINNNTSYLWDSAYGIGVGRNTDAGTGPTHIYMFGGSDNGTSKCSRVNIDRVDYDKNWIDRNIVGVAYGGTVTISPNFTSSMGVINYSYLFTYTPSPETVDIGTVPNSGEWAVFGWNAESHNTLSTAPIGTRIYELHINLNNTRISRNVQYDFYPVKVGNYGGLAKYQDGVFIENLLASNPASVIYGTQTTSKK